MQPDTTPDIKTETRRLIIGACLVGVLVALIYLTPLKEWLAEVKVLKSRIDDARIRAQQGLPVPDTILGAESALIEPTTAKDPTAVVTAFLAKEGVWKTLHQSVEALRHFLDANRHKDFDLSRRLVALATDHPLPEGHPQRATFELAAKDLGAIVDDKAVIERWSDYRSAFNTAFAAYRDAFVQSYDEAKREG